MLVITPNGSANEGQAYSLSCELTGDESLAVIMRHFQWETLTSRAQVDEHNLLFDPLSRDDQGEYRCTTTITSPYLTGNHSRTMVKNIVVKCK